MVEHVTHDILHVFEVVERVTHDILHVFEAIRVVEPSSPAEQTPSSPYGLIRLITNLRN